MAVRCNASKKIRFAHVPADGDPGLTIIVNPTTITFNTASSASREVAVEVYRGGKKLQYGEFSCSTLSSDRTITKGLTWTFTVSDDDEFRYKLSYAAGNDISMSIPFTVTLDGVKYPASIGVQTVKNGTNGSGSDGKNGVWVPPMMLWSDYPKDYMFQAGDASAGDVRLDMVVVKAANGNLVPYRCLHSHIKGDYPYSPETRPDIWAPADAGVYKCLATELLAAQNARIDFMSGQAVRVGEGAEICGYFGAPTSEGAILYSGGSDVSKSTFVVYKDGRIVAKNADIEGAITATVLDLKVASDGHETSSLYYDVSAVRLPALKEGYARTLRIVNPIRTRSAPADLYLIPAASTVGVYGSLRFEHGNSETLVLSECGTDGAVYIELLGFYNRDTQRTQWGVIRNDKIE